MQTQNHHNPMNDLAEETAVESTDALYRGQPFLFTILQRLKNRSDYKPVVKTEDRTRPLMAHRVEHRDVEDEAQD